MTISGSVAFTNGVQVSLPSQLINVVANQTTTVAYTVDGTATGSIGGTIQSLGSVPVLRMDVSAFGPNSRTLFQQPPPANGAYSVGPLLPGTYSMTTTARYNNFDDAFTFPNSAYTPSRTGLSVGTGETTVNVSAEQAFANGTVGLTGAQSLQPFVSSGTVNLVGTSTSTNGGSSSDGITVSTRAFDLIASPGTWRVSSVGISFFRPAPFLNGNFSYSDNRPTNTLTIDAETPTSLDIPIELGEVTLTITVASGTFSNPSVFGSCVQRDAQNIVLWSSSFSFSTSGQNNVSQGTVTFATPAGQCTITPRVVINGQTVTLPNATLGVVAGSSQTVDVGGPTLSNISPAPEAIVSSSSISVSGRATDDVAVASVTVNGVATSLSSAGNPSDPAQVNFFTVSPITLQRGPNTITIVARDVASPPNTTTDTRTVYWDTALPTLNFTPATGFTTFDSTVSVSGTASDDAGIQRITVNGVDVSFTSTNNPSLATEVSFSTTISLVAGSNPITVVVRDISNRTTTQTHTVTRQQQAPTTLTVSNASAVYNGTVNLTATLLSQGNPVSGKTIQFTLNGQTVGNLTNASGVATVSNVSVSGLDVSSYPGAIAASFAGDANFQGSSGTATLTVTQATASLALGNLSHTYDGTPKSATATTTPSGLTTVTITYNGSTTPPTNAGNYSVVASLGNPNYQATNATGTLVIARAPATLALGNLAQTYDGSPKTVAVTTSPAGLSGVAITYDGSPTAPTNAGSYAVVATLTNGNYEAPNATGTLVIGKATATITLSDLTHIYNGSPKSATATTSPAGLTIVSITYNGSATPPTNAGNYAVVATLTNANYEAANGLGTLSIAKANQAIAVTTPVPAYAVYATTFGTAATGGGSGNPVTITIAGGVCSVSAGGVGNATIQMLSGTGTCTVYYNQLGDANYNPALQATGTTTAQKASQSIAVTTAAPVAALFGSSFTVAATGGGSGNQVTYTTPANDGCSDVGPTFNVTSGVVACYVQYNQAGNANYNAATQVVQTVGTVGYAVEGFFAPIDMPTGGTPVWNRANAGQAIPVKWRLTLNGQPVASGASFVGLFSQEVNCGTGDGIEDAIEEYAPGASGLIYDGDGRFQFNWKTPTTYKNKCRAMYVSFSDGSVSPVASFKFK
jgi:hypothetical protein